MLSKIQKYGMHFNDSSNLYLNVQLALGRIQAYETESNQNSQIFAA